MRGICSLLGIAARSWLLSSLCPESRGLAPVGLPDQNGCRPEQIHLALTDDPHEMRISWKTDVPDCMMSVSWGQPGHLNSQSKSQESTYAAEDMCTQPASEYEFEPPILHTAVMSGLEPGQRYEYLLQPHGTPGTFKAPPVVGPDSGFAFVTYGDMGESEDWQAKSPGAQGVMDYVNQDVDNGVELAFHQGDIAYADGDPRVWNTFMDGIEPYASRVPYMVSIGNHEYDYRMEGGDPFLVALADAAQEQDDAEGLVDEDEEDEKLRAQRKLGKQPPGDHRARIDPFDASGELEQYDPDWGNYGNDSGGECGVTTAARFPMPGAVFPFVNAAANGSLEDAADNHHHHHHHHHHHREKGGPFQNSPFWYSFDYGSAHFTVISGEHDITDGSDQFMWFEEDLSKVDRCVTPWLFVVLHRPMYVIYPHRSNRVVAEHLREQLEFLLERYMVDLVLSAHVHSYSRSCNIMDGRCVDFDEGGTTHLIIGCGGRKLSRVKYSQADWVEYAEKSWGYGRISVKDGSELSMEWVRTEDGQVLDGFELRNTRAERRHCQRDNAELLPQRAAEWSLPNGIATSFPAAAAMAAS
ncbi:hypothetical protein WJX84_002861 [Apatococcus fuscideae]|uniref:Purple acid phosphatase n=1 Tax=Apatococcus fuscideae TaxID=2026836 RepID=A0AAW1TKI4_9CHLO